MAEHSSIEWTDATWNPWYGCRKVSPGCAHCYAEQGMTRYGWNFQKVRRAKDATFYAPLKWKKPRKIFTCSWSDFFIEEADQWREEAWRVICETSHHTYQILTKRPERIADFATRSLAPGDTWNAWPAGNVWLGVSAENQPMADLRIPLLLQVPAAVRFLSVEPLLGPVDLRRWLGIEWSPNHHCWFRRPLFETSDPRTVGVGEPRYKGKAEAEIDWVIVGGESGPNARPMHPDWVRSIRDQCVAAVVPFFFKQWGEWAPSEVVSEELAERTNAAYDEKTDLWKVGKLRAGRLLGGREWNQMPQHQGG